MKELSFYKTSHLTIAGFLTRLNLNLNCKAMPCYPCMTFNALIYSNSSQSQRESMQPTNPTMPFMSETPITGGWFEATHAFTVSWLAVLVITGRDKRGKTDMKESLEVGHDYGLRCKVNQGLRGWKKLVHWISDTLSHAQNY